MCDVRHEVTEGSTVTRKQLFGERKLHLLLYKILLILILKIVQYEAFNFDIFFPQKKILIFFLLVAFVELTTEFTLNNTIYLSTELYSHV